MLYANVICLFTVCRLRLVMTDLISIYTRCCDYIYQDRIGGGRIGVSRGSIKHKSQLNYAAIGKTLATSFSTGSKKNLQPDGPYGLAAVRLGWKNSFKNRNHLRTIWLQNRGNVRAFIQLPTEDDVCTHNVNTDDVGEGDVCTDDVGEGDVRTEYIIL